MSGAYAPIEVGVEAYIERDGQLLLGLRGPKCYLPGTWGMPGGRMELMEEPVAGVRREVLEELGITVAPEQVSFLAVVNDPQPSHHQHHLHLTHRVSIGAAEPRVMEPDSCDEWRWFPLDRLPDNVFPPHALILRQLGVHA